MTTILPWKASLPFAVVFSFKGQRRKDGSDLETDTVSGFQNTPELHYRAKPYSALSFDRILYTFSTWRICFHMFSLSPKAFVMCYCFRDPIRTFFFDSCEMSLESRVLHLFPVPQTGRSHIINTLLASFFSVCTVNYGSRFFSIDLWKKTWPVIYSTDRKLG